MIHHILWCINILHWFCPCEFSIMAMSHSPRRNFPIKQASKQTIKQTKHTTCVFGFGSWLGILMGSWLGILAWDLDLGSWISTSNASNWYGLLWTWTILGPIWSTAHSSNGIECALRSGRNQYPLLSNLFLWQKKLRLSASQCGSL